MAGKGHSRIDLAAFGFAVSLAAGFLSPCAADEPLGTAVLTRSYDNGRTGANLSETHFTPALVTSKGLKRVRSFQIDHDPRIEAQPLYVPGAQMPDGKKHNVLFIASMANHVWAFDVDGSGVWKTPTLGSPFNPPETEKPGQHRSTTIDSKGINILWGILSTPVIDADTNRMYVVNWITQENPPNPPQPSLFAHRIDLATMQEVGQPLRIQATFTDEQGKPVLDAHGKLVVLHPDQKTTGSAPSGAAPWRTQNPLCCDHGRRAPGIGARLGGGAGCRQLYANRCLGFYTQ
jgi:hypothetical protein